MGITSMQQSHAVRSRFRIRTRKMLKKLAQPPGPVAACDWKERSPRLDGSAKSHTGGWLRYWVPVCLLLHLMTASVVVWRMSSTYDEPHHLAYGRKILRLDPERRGEEFDSKSPLSALNVMPERAGRFLETHGWLLPVARALQTFRVTRIPTVMASMRLAFLVFRWSRELYGEWSGRISVLLYVLSPTVLAHGTLATTDMYLALTSVAAFYFFYRFLKCRSWSFALIAAAAVGCAQPAKASAICLLLF